MQRSREASREAMTANRLLSRRHARHAPSAAGCMGARAQQGVAHAAARRAAGGAAGEAARCVPACGARTPTPRSPYSANSAASTASATAAGDGLSPSAALPACTSPSAAPAACPAPSPPPPAAALAAASSAATSSSACWRPARTYRHQAPRQKHIPRQHPVTRRILVALLPRVGTTVRPKTHQQWRRRKGLRKAHRTAWSQQRCRHRCPGQQHLAGPL